MISHARSLAFVIVLALLEYSSQDKDGDASFNKLSGERVLTKNEGMVGDDSFMEVSGGRVLTKIEGMVGDDSFKEVSGERVLTENKVKFHSTKRLSLVKDFVFTHKYVRRYGYGTADFLDAASHKMNMSLAKVLPLVHNNHLARCPFPKLKCNSKYRYRSMDGSCNNLKHPTYGMARTPFRRFISADYSLDGEYWRKAKDGSDLPNARKVSDSFTSANEKPHGRQSAMVMHFGQFLDHDLTLTAATTLSYRPADESGTLTCGDDGCDPKFHPACRPIPTPGRTHQCIKFVRSLQVPAVKCKWGLPEQLNEITAFLDASNVYGSSVQEMTALRDPDKGRGRLLDNEFNGEKLLPPTDHPTCANSEASNQCFLAGDIRVNEQNGLTTLHTLFMRVHNRIEGKLFGLNKKVWKGERLYQESRKIVIAILQHIVFSEFLPQVLGRREMKRRKLNLLKKGCKSDYNPHQDPSIMNEFATAAYRFGHSLIPEVLYRPDAADLPLEENFFFPDNLYGGLDGILSGMSSQKGGRVDNRFADAVRNKLFGSDDLVALNLQRGRDHGIPGYRAIAKACKLKTADKFRQLRRLKSSIRNIFKSLYKHVDDIDLFAAGVSEEKVSKGAVGATFACIIAEQFKNLRNGDRFWYENCGVFTADQLAEIRKATLSKLICLTSKSTKEMPPNAFLLPKKSKNRVTACDLLPGVKLRPWRIIERHEHNAKAKKLPLTFSQLKYKEAADRP